MKLRLLLWFVGSVIVVGPRLNFLREYPLSYSLSVRFASPMNFCSRDVARGCPWVWRILVGTDMALVCPDGALICPDGTLLCLDGALVE